MKPAQLALVGTLLMVLASSSATGQPVAVPKTNPMKVYMHYMPWFETPATLGPNQWGWHWRMNTQNPNIVDSAGKRQIASHFYPKIGPYASSDADVIEYHLLLMKLSGVDGVLIDWYGVQGTNGDIGSLLVNSNAVVDRVGQYGLDFGVVLEDRFASSINDTKANVAYLRDHYFNQPEYIRQGTGNDPLLMVFGPITFESESEWTQILAEAGEEVGFLTLWGESDDAGANADGEYSWVWEDESLDDYQAHLSDFYRGPARWLGTVGGSAFPGFVDFYEEGGVGSIVPFEIPHNNGQTLQNTLALAAQYSDRIDLLQLVTWNDFGEGTIFEPTVETGFDYLLQLRDFTGTPYGESELQLVYRLYLARKQFAGDVSRQTMLDQVSAKLAALEIGDAETLLDLVAPLGDYDGDGDVDGQDATVWLATFGTSTILFGGGADGNFDGVVDAADYTVWRDNLGAGTGAAALAATVPEPSTLALSLLVLVAWRSQMMLRLTRGG